MLAMLYATYIIKGLKFYADVPELLKPRVKEILIEEGFGHLAE